MTIPRSLAERISVLPLGSDTEHRTLDLTTADASIALAPGAYEAYLDGAALGYARIGAAVSVPSSGAAAVAGQWVIPAGGAVTFVLAGGTTVTLHAQLASSTGTLHLVRKPL